MAAALISVLGRGGAGHLLPGGQAITELVDSTAAATPILILKAVVEITATTWIQDEEDGGGPVLS